MNTTSIDSKRYVPYGAARSMWVSKVPELMLDGPAGTGKTRACLEKMNLCAMKFPRMRGLICRKERSSMSESILVTFEDKVIPSDWEFLHNQQRTHRHSYCYPNGSEIIVGGLDKIGKIMSTEYDMIIVFEATEITENEWEQLGTRLRNGVIDYQQLIAECNPGTPTHWLKLRSDKGYIKRFASKHEDNPSLELSYLARLDKSLTGHRRGRLLKGEWVAAEGLVYPDFPSCIVDHFEPPDGAVVGGIDFGYKNPFCALIGTLYEMENDEEDSILYIWHERYKSKVSIPEHCAAINNVVGRQGCKFYADPSEPGHIHDMRRHSINVRGANNNILGGVDRISRRLALGTLKVSNRCKALIEEMNVYRYPDNGKGGEKPVDEFNHACDTLRYLINGVDRRRVDHHDG